MKRPARAASALCLAAVLCLSAGMAHASDFYTPSPVPSSRDRVKAKAGETRQVRTQNNSYILNQKIVKTTKPAEGEDANARKKPGAL